jgi:hypothetical protein
VEVGVDVYGATLMADVEVNVNGTPLCEPLCEVVVDVKDTGAPLMVDVDVTTTGTPLITETITWTTIWVDTETGQQVAAPELQALDFEVVPGGADLRLGDQGAATQSEEEVAEVDEDDGAEEPSRNTVNKACSGVPLGLRFVLCPNTL